MADLTVEQMVKRMFRMRKKYKEELERVLPITIGNAAVNLFAANFDKQGFDTGNGVEKWKEVQRRISTSNAYKYPKNKGLSRRLSAILVNTGKGRRAVHNSLRTPRISGGAVIIPFEVASDYMGYHNYGGSTKGRPPQRKFMADSAALHRIIDKKIRFSFNKVIKTK